MLNETPFADVRLLPGGLSIPELKWRELLFTGALRAEGEFYVRDPTRPMSPFEIPDPFPVGVRFRVQHAGRERGAGARVVCTRAGAEPPPPPPEPAAAVFALADLQDEHVRRARPYFEFVCGPALNLGLYRPAAGAEDPPLPAVDRVYLVLAGRARLTLDGQEQDVGPGALVFVPACRPHRFRFATEDLSVLVMGAPAEDRAAR